MRIVPWVIIHALVAGGFIVDRMVKAYLMTPASSAQLLDGAIRVYPVLNDTVALNIPIRGTSAIVLSGVVISVALIVLTGMYRRSHFYGVCALLLLVAGGFSNILDRYRYGGVVDYLHLGFFPSFNLADTMIVLGALLITVALVMPRKHLLY